MDMTDQTHDGSTLVEILDGAVPANSGSPAHDQIAAAMQQVVEASTGSRRFRVELRDTLPTVEAWVREGAGGRPLGPGATWLRFVDPARGTGLVAVIHSPMVLTYGGHEADFILTGHPGMLSRGLIRDLCRWAFHGVGLRRVVVRTHPHNPVLSDLVRRGGFEYEGRARDFFRAGYDASVWAMTADRCRWLQKVPAFAPDLNPPASTKVH